MAAKFYKLIGIDPGGTTGICIFNKVYQSINAAWSYESMFKFQQLDTPGHHRALWKLLSEENPTKVICERFDSRPAIGGLGNGVVNLDAREYIGVTKLYCGLTEKELHLQTAASAKGLWPDYKLKALALWQPAQRHSMDALRHVLYYLTSTGDHVPLRAIRNLHS